MQNIEWTMKYELGHLNSPNWLGDFTSSVSLFQASLIFLTSNGQTRAQIYKKSHLIGSVLIFSVRLMLRKVLWCIWKYINWYNFGTRFIQKGPIWSPLSVRLFVSGPPVSPSLDISKWLPFSFFLILDPGFTQWHP